ncbi:MAG TPA: isoprenylcysteine carboxylmethyltransferase family protein [Thermodesulfovibrionales bacterium]|nr:isoprenylcysteine carboxylmethyltransferase family protein [Thermodesulfovibrionales bacterium]
MSLSGSGITKVKPHTSGISGRRPGDFILFGVTSVELALLIFLTPTFTIADWIYVLQHILVLVIVLTRRAPEVKDHSLPSSAAVVIAYAYPYAQVAYLRWVPGDPAWPSGGLVLVILAACLSLASLLTLGRLFGVFPALRGLATRGPYGLVRHPMYLAYVLADIGYNLEEWNFGTALLVMAGWASLLYRIHAEERILSHDARWSAYVALVRYRLIPGLW